MNRIIIYVLMMLLSINVFAENVNPGEASKGTIKGFVFDTNANKPLEYATIAIISKKDNQVDVWNRLETANGG